MLGGKEGSLRECKMKQKSLPPLAEGSNRKGHMKILEEKGFQSRDGFPSPPKVVQFGVQGTLQTKPEPNQLKRTPSQTSSLASSVSPFSHCGKPLLGERGQELP